MDIVVLQALALHKQKRADEAMKALKYAIHLGEPDGWVRPFVEPGPVMADLLRRLAKRGAALAYASRLLAALAKEDGRAVSGVSEFRAGRGLSLTSQPPIEPLTNREEEILELLTQRLRDKEIAEQLFISSETVKSHLKHLYQKLHVSNRRQAVARARAMGILPGH
jgi:LuxR family maltose regulon positive regulatory protein